MVEDLVEGTKLGSYQPCVEKMEMKLEMMIKQLKKAYDETSLTLASNILEGLKRMCYKVVSWDSEYFLSL